jgi:hypothetical protein
MTHTTRYPSKAGTDKRTGQVRPSSGIMKVSPDRNQTREWSNHKKANAKRLLMNSPAGAAMIRTGQTPGRGHGRAVQSPFKRLRRGVK